MKILIIGQCSLHWGRMEFGNIGNFYILEPFVRELHAAFPGCEIRTTMQLSRRFCEEENVVSIPMELYYAWRPSELIDAQEELAISEEYKKCGAISRTTPYIDAVMWADLVIDFSGDIWGDNANFLGPDRFQVGLIKDQVAINFGKRVAMLAGSPGPFSNEDTKQFAKEVYAGFDLVTNREPISTKLLQDAGFDTSRTQTLACPAFLFEPASSKKISNVISWDGQGTDATDRPVVGFILCGWNFGTGPFDRWPRSDDEYIEFCEAIEFLTGPLGARVCLMSHSNGFDPEASSFTLLHGRDYPIIKQLQRVLASRGIARNVVTLDGVYDAWESKAVIGSFDMLVSGRVHAAVAGLSQSVPTVIIDYGHEPKAHKLRGFATVAGVEDFVADPASANDLTSKIESCWNERQGIKRRLDDHIQEVKELAVQNFQLLKELFRNG